MSIRHRHGPANQRSSHGASIDPTSTGDLPLYGSQMDMEAVVAPEWQGPAESTHIGTQAVEAAALSTDVRRLIETGLSNDSFDFPPRDTTLQLVNETNPLPGWSVTREGVHDGVVLWESWGAAGRIKMSMPVTAPQGSNIYLVQDMPVAAGDELGGGRRFLVRIEFGSVGTGLVPDYELRVIYLNKFDQQLGLSISSGSVSSLDPAVSGDSDNIYTLVVGSSFHNAPDGATKMRVQVGIKQPHVTPGGEGTFYVLGTRTEPNTVLTHDHATDGVGDNVGGSTLRPAYLTLPERLDMDASFSRIQMLADITDIAPEGQTVVILQPDANRLLHGIATNSYRFFWLVNDSNFTVTLKHESATQATLHFRFSCPGNADLVIPPRGSALVGNIGTSVGTLLQRWFVFGDSTTHPDLAAHDALGLTTQAEFDAAAVIKAPTATQNVRPTVVGAVPLQTQAPIGSAAGNAVQQAIDTVGALLWRVVNDGNVFQQTTNNVGRQHLSFSANTNGAQEVIYRSRGAMGLHGVLLNGDLVALLRFFGSDGAAWVEGVRIASSVSGVPAAGDVPMQLYFMTKPPAGALATRLVIGAGGEVRPGVDNALNLGLSTFRWKEIFAGIGVINTSDAREKDWRGGLNEAELRVAKRLSKRIGVYQMREMVTAKGTDAARLHVGVTAQDVAAEFAAEGLDAERYGMFCYDQWDEMTEPPTEEDGEPTVTPAGDRYGIRYDELAMFILAGLEARLAALED